MKKLTLAIMLALGMTTGASAQQGTESEPAIQLRGCRVGTPNPQFTPRRAQLSQNGESARIGNRHQLVVLASFQDQDFAEDHDATLLKWNNIFNAENYVEDRFVGSVRDYFMAQSYGQFNLTFDLYFVELPDVRYKYRSTSVDDEYSQYMVNDIVDALETKDIDWSLYDWDGDSFVDQLLIVYAEQGMNAGGGSNTIWPHQWWLSQHKNLETDDPYDYCSYRTVMQGETEYYVDCYCCVQELEAGNPPTTPFGTLCHEYSHCFGLPDYYYSGSVKVVGNWDLMDFGNYNGDGYRPCSYSAHERMLMGWLTPVELTSGYTVTDMPALVDEPVAYLVRNDGEENEYYIVENRQQRGWDEDLPGNGIIIFHIDYDEDLWVSATTPVNNSHRKRYQIFPANNKSKVSASSGWAYPYYSTDEEGNEVLVNDCLTNTSEPAATLLNPNIDGERLMSKPITEMYVDANGLASFLFMDGITTPIQDLTSGQALNEAARMYDLQGRRLQLEPAKGLYIQGNKLKIRK